MRLQKSKEKQRTEAEKDPNKCLPAAHVGPVYLVTHAHVKVLPVSVHVPPCMQGLTWQGGTERNAGLQ